MIENLDHKNSFSLIFGVLCLGVVYLHSNWLGGFDIYTLGLQNHTFTRLNSLLLLTIVPSFFIMWGYLSSKYLSSDEEPLVFFKRKLAQFYPIYILSFVINFSYRSEHMLSLPGWKLMLNFLGLYYESGMGGGGNIYIVVLFVILTVTLFKRAGFVSRGVLIFTIMCMALTKVLPHESSLCYIQYFGYYTAFFTGVALNRFGVFEGRYGENMLEKMLLGVFVIIGISTPLLNLGNIRFLEIQYDPNSFEQLVFCCLILCGANALLNKLRLPEKQWAPVKYLHTIGNNAYGHFIIHTHIIALFIYVNSIINLDRFVMQVFVIVCTSYISVFWVLRLYMALEARIRKTGVYLRT